MTTPDKTSIHFRPTGKRLCWTREKPNDTREFGASILAGTKLKSSRPRLNWYSAAKSSPYFTRGGEEEAPSFFTDSAEGRVSIGPRHLKVLKQGETPERDSPRCRRKCRGSARQKPSRLLTILGRYSGAKGKRGRSREVLNWVMWFAIQNQPGNTDRQAARLPSFEPPRNSGQQDQQFLFEGPLRLIFFSCHLDSTNGDTVEAFEFNKRKLINIAKLCNHDSASRRSRILTLTENRYVPIPQHEDGELSYIERWAANLKES